MFLVFLSTVLTIKDNTRPKSIMLTIYLLELFKFYKMILCHLFDGLILPCKLTLLNKEFGAHLSEHLSTAEHFI